MSDPLDEIVRAAKREALLLLRKDIKGAMDGSDCGCSPCFGHVERETTYEHCLDIVDDAITNIETGK